MSQFYISSTASAPPPIVATSYVTDIGAAVPAANVLNVLGSTTVAGSTPLFTTGSGNTVTVVAQRSQAIAASDSTKIGLSAFNSAQFIVDANGFVSTSPTGVGNTITGLSGGALSPVAGNWNIFGGFALAGSTPVTTSGAGNTLSVVVQLAKSSAGTGATNAGVASFNSAQFIVDANGFVSTNGANIPNTITGDTGGSLSPTAGNWNIVGGAALSAGTNAFVTSGSGSTLTGIAINCAKWIVDASATRGTHTTIAGAIAAASSGDTIFIRPGTYVENISLKAGVNICAFGCDGLLQIIGSAAAAFTANVIILGTVTAAFTGKVNIAGILFQTNGAAAINCTVAAAILNLINCTIYAQNATGITGNNTSLSLYYSTCRAGSATSLFALTGGQIDFEHCSIIMGGSATASTAADSNIGVRNCYTVNLNFSISATSLVAIFNSSFLYSGQTLLTTAGTGSSTIVNSDFDSGSATAIIVGSGTTLAISTASISSSNAAAISGAGTIISAGISFTNSSSANTVTTQTPRARSNDALVIKTPGAYPYTTIPQDAVILVDTSSARTIVPLASPATGQIHRIKDNVGSAAANNITITPSGKNIDGAASSIINVAYGSVDICYNGTQWNVL